MVLPPHFSLSRSIPLLWSRIRTSLQGKETKGMMSTAIYNNNGHYSDLNRARFSFRIEMRRFVPIRTELSPACSSLCASLRSVSHIKIANRRRVEMFMGQRFHVPTRLRTAAPDVAEEWDTEKNPGHLYPEIVGVGYMEPVWWKCKRCQHGFEMSVEKRVVRGGGCPVCTCTPHLREQQQGNKRSDGLEGKMVNAEEEDVLSGERNPALRAKRLPMFTIRTKY